jgi:hypothetical protein
MAVHVRNVTLKARVMDGDALLTPSLLDDIVSAVIDEIDARKSDDGSRASDTRIPGSEATP